MDSPDLKRRKAPLLALRGLRFPNHTGKVDHWGPPCQTRIQEYNHTVFRCQSLARLSCLLSLGLLLGLGQARAYDVLCRNGNAAFEAHFRTGVQVNVGPPKNGRLATRACRATLSWGEEKVIIADRAAEIDLDMFGVDLGLGLPVATFQVKQSQGECCMTYKIYSLEQPPRLLRSLQGGTYFRGVDNNFDGQIEIWTDDAAAMNGIEGLRASQVQFPPTSVLRYQNGKLLDVSSEFQPYFDQVISKVRTEMDPEKLRQFKLSRGALRPNGSTELEGSTNDPFLKIKEQVLQLVWAYLYSNRESEAWHTLAEMWPPADVGRIRIALMQELARGIRSQVDGVSHVPRPVHLHHPKIYNFPTQKAQPIMVRFYPSAELGTLRGKLRVDLLIDGAGKVWSVRVSGKNKAAFRAVKRSTVNWKFIPAFFNERPVAGRLRMMVSLEQ